MKLKPRAVKLALSNQTHFLLAPTPSAREDFDTYSDIWVSEVCEDMDYVLWLRYRGGM